MVAKSYEGLEQIGSPYEKNKRMYVLVKTKTGGQKEVRWYTDKEYARMYPGSAAAPKWNARNAFGFGDEGWITVYGTTIAEDDKRFADSKARYATWCGWYFVNEDIIPEGLPQGKRLNWELVGNEDNTLKSRDEVVKIVKTLFR